MVYPHPFNYLIKESCFYINEFNYENKSIDILGDDF